MNPNNPVNALLIADYILLKAKRDNVDVTNKKMQKLLYYVQAWSLALKGEKIFNDKIEAWIHGPAIKVVYLEFQKFGSNPIQKDISENVVDEISKEARAIIDDVWGLYSKYDANYLEYLTHSEAPWQKARNGLEPHISSESEITPDSMQEFYGKLVKH